MAKNNKKNNPENEKKTNPVLLFLFAVVFPILIVAVLLVVILNFAGIDVFGWVKDKTNDVPILSSVVTTEEEVTVQRLQEQLEEKEEQIEELEQLTEDQEATIEELERELLYYENSFESLEETDEQDGNRQVSGPRAQGATASSFANMESEQAAVILEEMARDDALVILQQVSSKVSGSILEAMNPEVAAELSRMLLEREGQPPPSELPEEREELPERTERR